MAFWRRSRRPLTNTVEVTYFLSQDVEEELASAIAFYHEQASISVANAFLSEFIRTARLIAGNPQLGKPISRGLRLFPLQHFPYSLVYRVEEECIRVAAVAHQSRRPGYWNARN